MKRLQLLLGCILLLGAVVWFVLPNNQQEQGEARLVLTESVLNASSLPDHPADTMGIEDESVKLFQIDAALRRSFDSWLEAVEGDDLESAWLKLEAYAVQQKLSEDAVVLLRDLFRRYIGYRQEIGDYAFPEGQNYLDQLRLAMEVKSAAAKRWFSPEESDAFFADEFWHDQQALERAMAATKKMTDEEQLEWLEGYLNEADEQTQRTFQPSLDLAKLTQTLAEGDRDYAHAYDAETVARIDALQEKRENWKERVEQYMDRKAQLAEAGELDTEQQQAQLSRLASELFTAQEQRRLDVFIRHPQLLDEDNSP